MWLVRKLGSASSSVMAVWSIITPPLVTCNQRPKPPWGTSAAVPSSCPWAASRKPATFTSLAMGKTAVASSCPVCTSTPIAAVSGAVRWTTTKAWGHTLGLLMSSWPEGLIPMMGTKCHVWPSHPIKSSVGCTPPATVTVAKVFSSALAMVNTSPLVLVPAGRLATAAKSAAGTLATLPAPLRAIWPGMLLTAVSAVGAAVDSAVCASSGVVATVSPPPK